MSEQDLSKINKDSMKVLWSIAILCILGVLTYISFHKKEPIQPLPKETYTIAPKDVNTVQVKPQSDFSGNEK